MNTPNTEDSLLFRLRTHRGTAWKNEEDAAVEIERLRARVDQLQTEADAEVARLEKRIAELTGATIPGTTPGGKAGEGH